MTEDLTTQPELNPANCHCEPESKSGKIAYRAGIAIAIGIVAVSTAPVILPPIGIGRLAEITTDPTALCGTASASGFAGLITKAISFIPVVGDAIAKGGLATAIAATIIIIVGSLAAKYAPNYIRPELGKIIKGISVAVGIIIALPAMLPAIKNGTLFLFAALDMYETGNFFASLIGNTGNPMPYAQVGSVATLFASHTGCILSALTVSTSTLWSMLGFKCKNNTAKLPAVELAQ